MLTGGAVYAYLDQVVPDKNSKILLTGYQVRETPGRILREKGVLSVDGQENPVTCGVDMFEFSAHVGKSGLHKTVKQLNPEKVIVVHGDADVEDQFVLDLKAEGFDAVAPAVGDTVNLK
jgi:putative mRNA 3-end processing factor